ncbi:MAG: ATP synthase subunit I [Deltaproteobacteria bacterium]|nr:ATP synthase subunit I [Deltaproteobacteria bacterium]
MSHNPAEKGDVNKAGAAKTASGFARMAIWGGAIAAVAGLLLSNRPTTGFAVGWMIAAVNMSWLLRIARRCLELTPEKAARSGARTYYLRFAATALVFTIVVSRKLIDPVPLLAGFSGSLFLIIGIMIAVAREEFRQDA